jgi:TPR repeat protein
VAETKRDYIAEARKAASGSPWLCRQILWALNPKWSGSMEAFQRFYEDMSACNWSEEGRRLLDAAYLTEMGDIALCQEDNKEKALSCCKQAADICDRPFAYMALANKLQWTEQEREAEAYYLKALSKEPNPDCYFMLGLLRECDLDDHQGAAEAYEKAVEFGHGQSAAYWAELHLTFEPQDRRDNPGLFDKIEAMLKLGMQQYSSDAWHLQAGRYLNGEGVPKNGKEAIPYWIEAAKLGSGISAKNLGLTYWNGSFGLKQEYDKAFQYMKLAVQLDEEGAYANLGRMYYRGHGTKQDYKAARHYLEIGAKAGSAEALADLARIYWLGHGVPSDRQVAETFLMQLREIDEPMYREVHNELNSVFAKLFRVLGGR